MSTWSHVDAMYNFNDFDSCTVARLGGNQSKEGRVDLVSTGTESATRIKELVHSSSFLYLCFSFSSPFKLLVGCDVYVNSS